MSELEQNIDIDPPKNLEADPAENPVGEIDAGDESVSAEDRARLMGWRPKEEYKGDPDEFKDAKDFLAANDPKSLRIQNRNMERILERQSKQIKDIIDRQDLLMQQERDKAYKQAEQDIAARYREAVSDGDIEGAETALREREALSRQKKEQEAREAMQPIVNDWISKNAWFTADRVMNAIATQYETDLARTRSDLSLEERLEATSAYIKAAFPEKEYFKQEKPYSPKTPPGTVVSKADNGRTRQAYQPGDERALNAEGRNRLNAYMAGFRNLTEKQRETIKSNYLKTSAIKNPEFYR